MDFIVLDEYLKGMTRHDDEVELAVPAGRREIARDPLDIRTFTRLRQHTRSRVESA